MALIPKATTATLHLEINDLEPIFELDEETPSPETTRKTVQKRSPSLKRKKEAHEFFQIDSPSSGRKISSRPIRSTDTTPSNSPPKEVRFFKTSSTTDSSASPTRADSPPITPPTARRTLSKQNLKPSSHLNRGNSLWEMLSEKIKSGKNHPNRRKHLFHHRTQPEKSLTFNSPKSIKEFIDGLKDSDRYRPLEIDFSGSCIRGSQFEMLLNHLSFKKCRSLILDGCSQLTAESFSFLIEKTKKLEQLDLSNLHVKHHDINKAITALILSHRKTLLSVSISNSHNLDQGVLQALTQCPKLQFLNLSNTTFHYDIMTADLFNTITLSTDLYALDLLNQSIKSCLKLVTRLESLELSSDDWDNLLTFRGLGKATNALNISDAEWQTLLAFRQDPDIREALNLPNDNWQELLHLKAAIQQEMRELNLPQWKWQDVYKLWTLRNSFSNNIEYSLKDLEKLTIANEQLQKLVLTKFQTRLLSLPDSLWDELLRVQSHPDQKTALRACGKDWQSLLTFRSFSTAEWRALSVAQRKLDSLNLSPTDFSTLSFLSQNLSFLPLTHREYHNFFSFEKLSLPELQAFISTNDELNKRFSLNIAIQRLYGLHQAHSYDETIPNIFIKISKALFSIYPTEPIDKNITSMQLILTFKNTLSTLEMPDITQEQNIFFKKDLATLAKTSKCMQNESFFTFLTKRVNLLPTLLSACPDLNSLDVSSFLLPFHLDDIKTLETYPLRTFISNDLEWVQEDMIHFQELFKHTPQLDSLSFANNGHSQELPFYKSSLPNLKHLYLNHQNQLTIDSLKLNDRHFQNLEELDLSFCPRFLEFPLVVFLLRKSRNLKSLHLDLPTFSFKNLKLLLGGISDSRQTQLFYPGLPTEVKENIPLPPPIKGLGDQLTSLTISEHLLTPTRLKVILGFCPSLQFLNHINLNDTSSPKN